MLLNEWWAVKRIQLLGSMSWVRQISWTWEAVTALSTLALVVITGIWIPFFSDLPRSLEKVSQLTGQNTKLLRDNQIALRQGHDALQRNQDALRQTQEAMLRNLAIQGEINQAHQEEITSDREVRALNERLSDARHTLSTVEYRRRSLEGELNASRKTLRESVDTTLTLAYNSRFAAFISDRIQRALYLLPTSDALAASSPSMMSYFFSILSKNDPFAGPMDKNVTYDAGAFFISGFRIIIALPQGVRFTIQQIPPSDDHLRSFVAFVNGRAAGNLVTYFDVSNSYGLDPQKPWSIKALLSRMLGSRSVLEIGFVPSKIDEVSYEDSLIRGFWFPAAGNLMNELGGEGDIVENQMSGATTLDRSGLEQATFALSKAQMDAFLQKARDRFGPVAFAYFRDRLRRLDEIWLRTLENEPVKLGPDQAFTFASPGHLNSIYRRWDWQSNPEAQSAIFLDDIWKDDIVKYVLSCSVSRFLHDNSISKGPDVLSTLEACHRSERMQHEIESERLQQK